MSTEKIKEKLIAEIGKSNNKELLEDISTLFKTRKSTRKPLQLSAEQIAAINIGIKQIEEGKGIPHEVVMKEAEKWLRKK
jgi:predicted transcriptional regulator